jgi:plastocyanin
MRSPLMILSLAALVACGGGSGTTGPGTTGGTNTGGNNTGGNNTGGTGAVATTAVDMKNLAFAPGAIKVGSGATVTWTNQDGVTHNVTFDNAVVAPSGAVAAGTAKALTMPTAAGTYPYHCTLHGTAMSGSVQVQ